MFQAQVGAGHCQLLASFASHTILLVVLLFCSEERLAASPGGSRNPLSDFDLMTTEIFRQEVKPRN
jgi:hypothetical protein